MLKCVHRFISVIDSPQDIRRPSRQTGKYELTTQADLEHRKFSGVTAGWPVEAALYFNFMLQSQTLI